MASSVRQPVIARRRPTRVALAVLVSALTACGAPDGAPACASGPCLSTPTSIAIEPGERVELRVRGLDLSGPAAFLWIDAGTDAEVAVPLLEADRNLVGDTWVLTPNVPILDVGPHTLRVSDDQTRTNPVTATVRAATSRAAQEDVALLVEAGLAALATVTWEAFAHPLEALDEFRVAVVPGDAVEVFETWFASMPVVAAAAGQAYRELDPVDELQLQALLHHLGLLGFFEELLAPSAGASTAPAGLVSDHRIIHGWLVQMDVLSTVIEASGHLLDVVTVVLAVSGPAASGLAVTLPAKFVIRTIKGLVDALLPTDLVAIEDVHIFDRAWDTPGAEAVFWGRFRPQEKVLEGAVSWTFDSVSASILHKIPGADGLGEAAKTRLREIGEAVFTKLATAAGLSLPAYAFSLGDDYVTEVKIPLDMGVYALSLNDVLSVGASLAGGGLPLVVLLRMLPDFEILPSVWGEVPAGAAPYWVEGSSRLHMRYEEDRLFSSGIQWPADEGAHHQQLAVAGRGISMGTTGLQFRGINLFTLPYPYRYASAPTSIVFDHYRGETEVNRFDPIHTRWSHTALMPNSYVLRGSGEREPHVYRLRIHDANATCRQFDIYPEVTVSIAHEPVFGPQELESNDVVFEFTAQPGANSFTIEAYAPACDFYGADKVWLEFLFLDSIQSDPQTDDFELRYPGGGWGGFRLWAPPPAF
jgi:hypothetical protein